MSSHRTGDPDAARILAIGGRARFIPFALDLSTTHRRPLYGPFRPGPPLANLLLHLLRLKEIRMFKKAGLSVCLCLMAVVSNCLIAAQEGTGPAGPSASHSVTSGPLGLLDRAGQRLRAAFEIHAPAAEAIPCNDGSDPRSGSRGCPRHDSVAHWF
jgi:hypothetical protein